MGASGWNYITEYRGDVESSLAALREREFARPDSYWRGILPLWDLPIPATLDELFTEPYYEFLGCNGTHCVIDVGFKNFEPLDPADLVDTFGSEQPDRAKFESVAGEHFENLNIFLSGRWYGSYVVLHEDGTPTEVAFWGFSGD